LLALGRCQTRYFLN